jgi:Na+/proline symporter
MLFFAVWQAIRPWMWAVVALVSIALFPVMPAPYTDTHAYPLVMDRYLGLGLRGLLIAAFAAAFMSTVTTQLNWGASYLVRDGYCRFLRPAATEREQVLVSRCMTVLLALAGLFITPLFSSLTAAWEFLALLPAGFGIISVLRWFWWRVNAWTELTVLAVGLVCALVDAGLRWRAPELVVAGLPWADWRYELKLLLFTTTAVSVAVIVTRYTPPVAMERLRGFNRKVRPGGWWGPVEAGDDLRGLPEPVLTRRTLLDSLGGLALCLGATMGLGFALLLRPLPAAVAFASAVAGGVFVHRWLRRMS